MKEDNNVMKTIPTLVYVTENVILPACGRSVDQGKVIPQAAHPLEPSLQAHRQQMQRSHTAPKYYS
jgi:hypothetical protein